MKRASVWLFLAALIVVIGATLAVTRPFAVAGQVYSVTEIQDGLRYHPQQWGGRVVLIRGHLTGGGATQCALPVASSSCAIRWVTIAASAGNSAGSQSLSFQIPGGVQAPAANSAVSALSRLPFVGPSLLNWVGDMSIRVLLAHPNACAVTATNPLCFDGVVLPARQGR